MSNERWKWLDSDPLFLTRVVLELLGSILEIVLTAWLG
jgi:hypothetical protein